MATTIEHVEARQLKLEDAINAGKLAMMQLEKRCEQQLEHVERRLVLEITRTAMEERSGVRQAVEGILEQISSEEERRADMIVLFERRSLEVERELRLSLCEAFRQADAEVQSCKASLAAQVAALDCRFQTSLQELSKGEEALRAELAGLPVAMGAAESMLGERCESLTREVEVQ